MLWEIPLRLSVIDTKSIPLNVCLLLFVFAKFKEFRLKGHGQDFGQIPLFCFYYLHIFIFFIFCTGFQVFPSSIRKSLTVKKVFTTTRKTLAMANPQPILEKYVSFLSMHTS